MKKGQIKVKITAAPSGNWYKNQIGSELICEKSPFMDGSLLQVSGLTVYIKVEDVEILEEYKPEPIEFDWGKYETGNYNVITREGIEVDELHLFESVSCAYRLVASFNDEIKSYTTDGKYYYSEMDKSSFDLFLIEK